MKYWAIVKCSRQEKEPADFPFAEGNMSLSEYEQKYVRIRTIYGDTLTGLARYGDCEFLRCEWGGKEEGLFIEDFLVYRSQIESTEEIEVHGTVELWTDRMILRRYRPEDAEPRPGLLRRAGRIPPKSAIKETSFVCHRQERFLVV